MGGLAGKRCCLDIRRSSRIWLYYYLSEHDLLSFEEWVTQGEQTPFRRGRVLQGPHRLKCFFANRPHWRRPIAVSWIRESWRKRSTTTKCPALALSIIMLAAECYLDLFADFGSLLTSELLEVRRSKISLRAKADYSYPTMRLPYGSQSLQECGRVSTKQCMTELLPS